MIECAVMVNGGRGKSAGPSGSDKSLPEKSVRNGSGRDSGTARSASSSGSVAGRFVPLTPRPGWLAVMSVVFAAWMALLGYLYLTTVHSRGTTLPTTTVSFHSLRADLPIAYRILRFALNA